MPNEPNKTKVGGGQTLVERQNRAGTRNRSEDIGGEKSPLGKSMESVPVITKDKRNTGKVG